MIVFGLLSSVFDVLTFITLRLGFHASATLVGFCGARRGLSAARESDPSRQQTGCPACALMPRFAPSVPRGASDRSGHLRPAQLAGAQAMGRRFYGRGGNCCSAQVLPSGSLKVTNEPHG